MGMHLNERILIAGVGGQGVLSLGHTIAQAAALEGRWVSWVPSYGAEMRGGVTTCTVVISDTPVLCPVVDSFGSFIALAPQASNLGSLVETTGLVLCDNKYSHLVRLGKDIRTVTIPAGDLGERLSLTRYINMIFLGAYLALQPVVSFTAVELALKDIFGQGEEIASVNQKALLAGKEYIEHNA
ncbi:MAG: 2-oxoacid:acceptor oxidoreductase family protein [Clostridia bacterium]|nr:2-oxoacid:acceptor oxidoreductase family protein [Clostridia bacterium]